VTTSKSRLRVILPDLRFALGSALYFWLIIFLNSPAKGEERSPVPYLDSLYKIGDYERIIREGEELLAQETKREAKVEILRLLAFSSVALTRREEAESYFLHLLYLSPKFSLDPLNTSPKIMEVFLAARSGFEKGKKEKLAVGFHPLIYFYPGLSQLKNGDRFKGYFLTSLTTVSAIGFFTTAVLTPIYHKRYLDKRVPAEIESAYNRYKLIYITRQVFGIGLAFSYGLHILDLKFAGPR